MILIGRRRDAAQAARVTVELKERLGSSRFAAVSSVPLASGDRVQFGDASNRVCLLGTLVATVVAVEDQNRLLLDFEYRDDALDEMLAAVAE